MRNTLSKGPGWHSTGQISYATIMSEVIHIDGKPRCIVSHIWSHEIYSPMY
jgi:hypothetical protein